MLEEIKMNQIKQFCTIFCLVVLLQGCGRLPQSTFVKAIEKNYNSIHILGNVNAKNEIHVEGSGFFINEEGYYITNLHAILGAIKYYKEHPDAPPVILIRENFKRDNSKITLKVLKPESFPIKDETFDIAVIKTTPNPFNDSKLQNNLSIVNLNAQIPPDGTRLIFSGFPEQTKIISSREGILGSLTIRKHEISNNDTPVLEIDTSSATGYSGSPLYLSTDGAVVGIVVGGVSSCSVTTAIPIKYALKLLDEKRIKWY